MSGIKSGSATTAPERPLRVAIVGAGRMARHHAIAVQRARGSAGVVAIADPSRGSLEEALALCPGARGAENLDQLLDQGEVDVVHIVTPPATHAELAARALEAGCHVYVEKPFVTRTAEACRIAELAGSRGLALCAGHQLLFESPAVEIRGLLPALGTPVHVESYFSFRPTRSRVGGRPALRPDLQLLDILPHPVYVLLDFLERLVPDGRTEVVTVEARPGGTIHALVRRGELAGSLIVSLSARPIESYLDVVGTNGRVRADFVRSTVQRRLGPGASSIDKLLDPFRVSRQLVSGTTRSLASRVLRRRRTYPGLVEIFEAFYAHILGRGQPPMSTESIVETVRVCELVEDGMGASVDRGPASPATSGVSSRGPKRAAGRERVLVTGGTGFLGAAVVRGLLDRGQSVRVVARRLPAPWDRIPGVEYAAADLAESLPSELLQDVRVVIHCAAATSGGWEEHQRLSLDATEHVIRSMAKAGVTRLIHISSLAVLASPENGKTASEATPLESNSRGSGPYVWGKLESERLAVALGKELGAEVKVVRPGAIVDMEHFEPPGRLGKRLGNLFVAVGSPGDALGLVDLDFAARSIASFAEDFASAPPSINLLSPEKMTKRELLGRLRSSNPDLRVVWLPRPVLVPLSWTARLAQRILRPGKPAIDVAKVFGVRHYDRSRSTEVARSLEAEEGEMPERRTTVQPGA